MSLTQRNQVSTPHLSVMAGVAIHGYSVSVQIDRLLLLPNLLFPCNVLNKLFLGWEYSSVACLAPVYDRNSYYLFWISLLKISQFF